MVLVMRLSLPQYATYFMALFLKHESVWLHKLKGVGAREQGLPRRSIYFASYPYTTQFDCTKYTCQLMSSFFLLCWIQNKSLTQFQYDKLWKRPRSIVNAYVSHFIYNKLWKPCIPHFFLLVKAQSNVDMHM